MVTLAKSSSTKTLSFPIVPPNAIPTSLCCRSYTLPVGCKWLYTKFFSFPVNDYICHWTCSIFLQNTRKEMDLCYIPADGNTWKTGLIAYRLPGLP